MILDNRKEMVVPFVESIGGVKFDYNMVEALGCERDGALAGGIVYSHFNGASCEMSVASAYPGWLTRQFTLAMFHYPFVQADLIKVIGLIRSDNARSIEFATRLGFKLETKITDVYAHGVDCVIVSMRREECKWLPAAEKWFAKLAA